MKKIHPRVIKDQNGFALVLLGLTIVVLLGFAALAVDIGYLYAARNELQNAADAAALAGARELGKIYLAGPYVKGTASGGDTYKVFVAAKDVAGKNVAAGESVTIQVYAFKKNQDGTDFINADGKKEIDPNNVSTDGADVVLGEWQWTAASGTDKLKTAGVDHPNAVRVYAKRQKEANPVTLFFASVLGIVDAGVSAVATAALSGDCIDIPGLPLGIGRSWFTNIGANKGCTQIALNKTKESCAGWTNLSTKKYDHKDVQAMLDDPTKIPTVKAGDFVEFNGGTTQKVVDALDALFKRMRTGSPATWTTGVVVFEDDGICGNPGGTKKIIGFATVKIKSIILTGNDKGPEGEVQCNLAEQERGGCFYAGTYGAIAGLVQ